jgi:hypothetical protein
VQNAALAYFVAEWVMVRVSVKRGSRKADIEEVLSRFHVLPGEGNERASFWIIDGLLALKKIDASTVFDYSLAVVDEAHHLRHDVAIDRKALAPHIPPLREEQDCSPPDSTGQLSHLRVLHCSYNNIAVLPDSIGQLSSLQTRQQVNRAARVNWETLYVYYNEELEALPSTIDSLSKLKDLSASGCALSNAEKERLKATFGANTDAGNSFGGWKWSNSSGLELIL